VLTRRQLLAVSASIEWGAGVGFAIAPSLMASLIVGGSLDTPAATTVGRVAGAALFCLGTACWLTRDHGRNPVTALVIAMLIYNIAAAAILVTAATVSNMTGIGLWPTVVLHLGMAAWCLASLLSTPESLPAEGR